MDVMIGCLLILPYTNPRRDDHLPASVPERSPVHQSIQFYEVVTSIGKAPDARLALYPDQGYGVSKPRLRRDLMACTVRWLGRWIPTPRTRAAGHPAEKAG